MGRSSRLLGFIALGVLTSASVARAQVAHSVGAPVMAGPVMAGPGVAGQGIGLGGRGPVGGGMRGGSFGGHGPGGYPRQGFPQQFVGPDLGFYELNSGRPNPTFEDVTPVDTDDRRPPAYAPPLGFFPAPPPPCVTPHIIRIGRGIKYRVTTRVIYGLPPCE